MENPGRDLSGTVAESLLCLHNGVSPEKWDLPGELGVSSENRPNLLEDRFSLGFFRETLRQNLEVATCGFNKTSGDDCRERQWL